MLTRSTRLAAGRLGAGILSLVGVLAASPQETRDTKPFRVNSSAGEVFLTSRFTRRSVGIDARGNFVAVWQDETPQARMTGVYARAFDARGKPRGPEIPVFVNAQAGRDGAAVAVDPSGRAVIVWCQLDLEAKSGVDIWAQRLNKDGKLEGKPLRLNSPGRGNRNHPSVTFAADGSFVLVWTGTSKQGFGAVFARRFDQAGSPLTAEIQASTDAEHDASGASVVALPGGQFAVAFGAPEQGPKNITLRVFDASGKTLSDGTRVNRAASVLGAPSVACDSGGGLLAVAWHTFADDKSHVLLRIFDSSGRPRTAEQQVEPPNDDEVGQPTVSFAGDHILVGWDSYADGHANRVLGRYFLADGRPEEGVAFGVDDGVPGLHSGLSISANARGDAAAVWNNHIQGAHPAIMARRWTWPRPRRVSSQTPLASPPAAHVRGSEGRSDEGEVSR